MIRLSPVAGDAPCMRRALAFLSGIFVTRAAYQDLPHPAKPTAQPPSRTGPQQLGPNQLKWLEERFQFYGIHRKQAEAPTGVAAVVPERREL